MNKWVTDMNRQSTPIKSKVFVSHGLGSGCVAGCGATKFYGYGFSFDETSFGVGRGDGNIRTAASIGSTGPEKAFGGPRKGIRGCKEHE